MSSSLSTIPPREKPPFSKERSSSLPKKNSFNKFLEKMEKPEEKKKEEEPSIFTIAADYPLPTQVSSFSFETITPPAKVDMLCEDFLNELSLAIVHMAKNQDKETTVHIQKSWCGDTGLTLIIREFSTAPLSYTILFQADPSLLNTLTPHLAELRSLFQNTDKEYTIHSIDIELENTSPFLFRRKSPVSKNSPLSH